MYGLTRGVVTLLGVALAGFLIWIATQIDDGLHRRLLGGLRNRGRRGPDDGPVAAARRLDEGGLAEAFGQRLPARLHPDPDRGRLGRGRAPAASELGANALPQFAPPIPYGGTSNRSFQLRC